MHVHHALPLQPPPGLRRRWTCSLRSGSPCLAASHASKPLPGSARPGRSVIRFVAGANARESTRADECFAVRAVHLRMKTVFAVLALTVACGSSNAASEDGGDESEPVAATPLEGTVGGSPFRARSAVGSRFDSEVVIYVYETEQHCAPTTVTEPPTEPAEEVRERLVSTTVVWKTGVVETVGERAFGTSFVVDGTDSTLASSGRIEVVEAGATGTLRLRARAENGDHVEGEIAVEICE